VAYSVEGGHSKLAATIKKMCLEDPALAHSLLEKYTESLCLYASYQVEKQLLRHAANQSLFFNGGIIQIEFTSFKWLIHYKPY
jgi:uroporphyrinogen-III decarboxylase